MKFAFLLSLSYFFLSSSLCAQTKDSIPCQSMSIISTDDIEIELDYVLPRAKQLFIKDLNNNISKTHAVLQKELNFFYNDDGIVVRDSDYPLRISQNQFLLTPISYFLRLGSLDSGYLIHKYQFLVSIPIVQTARKIRKMGTINLIMFVDDKEVISLAEEKKIEASDILYKAFLKSPRPWRTLKSYKRYISIERVERLKISEDNASN